MNPHPPEFDTIKAELLQAGTKNVSTRDIVERFKPNEIPHDTLLDLDLHLNLLHIAAWTGDVETLRELQNRADAAAKTEGGFSPLHLAASRGHSDSVTELVCWPGLDVTGIVSDEGFTPLHLAAYGGYDEIVKVLLKVNGLDVSVKDKLFGRTALHFAAQRGHEEVVRLLTSAAATEVDSKDRVRDLTPFLLAAMKPPNDRFNLRVVEILLDKKDGQINDKVGALTDQTTEVVKKFSEEVWRRLTPMEVDNSMKSIPGVEDTVDENEVDLYRRFAVPIEGHSALHLAATQNNGALVQHLVSRTGVPLQMNERDIGCGMTPLHCSVRTGAMKAFRALMEVDGVDVNAESAKRCTLQRPAWLPLKLQDPENFFILWECAEFDSPLRLAVRACRAEDLWAMVTVFINHPKFNAANHNESQRCPTALELAWQRLVLCPRPPSIFNVRRKVSEDPVERYAYEDRAHLNRAIDLLERHPSNAPIMSAAAETKKAVEDSVNAFLVTATLLVGVTFSAYLQPPIGTDVGDYRIKAAKLFWVFNSLSFHFAVYTILRALLLIMRGDQRWGHTFNKSRYVMGIRIQTAVPLMLSVAFGIGAFVAAGFGNLPSGGNFRNLMWACSIGGLLLVSVQLIRNFYLVLTFLVASPEGDQSKDLRLDQYLFWSFIIFGGPLLFPIVYGYRQWAHHRSGRIIPATFSYCWDIRMNIMFLGVQMWLAVAVVVYSVTQV